MSFLGIFLGKDEVTGSNPVSSSRQTLYRLRIYPGRYRFFAIKLSRGRCPRLFVVFFHLTRTNLSVPIRETLFPRNARSDSSRLDGICDRILDAGVEGIGDDVIGAELAFGDDGSDRLSRRDLHLIVDVACTHVERTAEDAGESEHVVDLVGEIAAAGADDLRTCGCRLVGHDLGHGVCHREDDGILCHRADHILREAAGGGDTDEHVCALDDVRKRACLLFEVGDLCHLFLDGVETVAAFIDGALPVAEDDLLETLAHEELGDGDARGTRAVDDDGDIFDLLARKLERVEHGCHRDDRRTVLVVVEDRDIAHLLEPLFDLKAAGRGDIFEVDAAEAPRKEGNGLDDLVDVLRTDAEREGVHVAEGLEESALALHDGHARFGTDIAEAEDCRAVRDDRHEVGTAGVDVRKIDVLTDLEAGLGDAGSIGDGEFFAVGDGRAGDHFDLACPFAVLVQCKLLLIHKYKLL